uniref:Uncharacterized protein n=1 Tax=Rhizophora mucronata TaxID=61149 RepID=A0A2P2INX7_RHIMU
MRVVHARHEDKKKPIFLNAKNQPIGLDDKTLCESSNFLRTLAKNVRLVPLYVKSWHMLDLKTKNALWKGNNCSCEEH